MLTNAYKSYAQIKYQTLSFVLSSKQLATSFLDPQGPARLPHFMSVEFWTHSRFELEHFKT